MELDFLFNLNIRASKKKSNSISDRIFRYAVSLVNTRNKYTYVESPEKDEKTGS